MKIYVHDEKTQGKILSICQKMPVDLLTPEQVRARAYEPIKYGFFLDEVDALILEITHPTQDTSFIIAQSLLASKPTLCLYGKNQAPRELISLIHKRQQPRSVRTFSYTDISLSVAVISFINKCREHNTPRADDPSIKFTLRLTPRMNQYLQWLHQKEGIIKADYLRELINRDATRNMDYQKQEHDEYD